MLRIGDVYLHSHLVRLPLHIRGVIISDQSVLLLLLTMDREDHPDRDVHHLALTITGHLGLNVRHLLLSNAWLDQVDLLQTVHIEDHSHPDLVDLLPMPHLDLARILCASEHLEDPMAL